MEPITLPAILLALAIGWGGGIMLSRRKKPAAAEALDITPRDEVDNIHLSLQRTLIENERLKREAQRFANIINMSPNPVWQRDENLNITYCNLAFSEVAEQTTERVLEAGELELYKGHRQLAQKAWETGQEQVERKHIVVSGQRQFYQIRELPLKQERTVTGYAADITELDEAQEEVQRHISAQADFLESSTNAMAIFGRDMRLKFYNFAFITLWKLEDSWLDSQPTYGEILEVLREKRRLPEQANFRAFKQQQVKLFTDLIGPNEEFFYLPDGKILRVVAIPHALGGLLIAYEDVSDRLALERSYNTLIAVQKETLDNLREAVVVFSEDGRIRLSNPAFGYIWKLSLDFLNSEPHVRNVMEHLAPSLAESEMERFQNDFVLRMAARNVLGGRLERSDATVLDWSSVPLPDGGTLLAFTDVTDSTVVERSLREKNEALEAADLLKSEFLANVSYELRSPLTSITGFADILRNNFFGELNDKQREYVEGIHQSSQYLGQLISDILDLASIEAGYLQLEVSEFDISTMLDSVISLSHQRIRMLDLTLRKSCDDHIGTMKGDETRIKQVLFNLLSNAVKYSRTGDTVEVSATRLESGWLSFTVEDHGVGIADEHQTRVFERFYRLGATEGQQSGTGLGLSIVRSFIELHGGRVELVSTPSAGTRVTCFLPPEPLPLEIA